MYIARESARVGHRDGTGSSRKGRSNRHARGAAVSVNPGPEVTVRLTVVVAVRLPEVPVMVTVAVPSSPMRSPSASRCSCGRAGRIESCGDSIRQAEPPGSHCP